MLNQNAVQSQFAEEVSKLKIPQFYIKTEADMFGDEYSLLEPENLSEGFSLVGQETKISFELATGMMYRIDLREQGDAVPQYKRESKEQSEYIRELLAKLPPEEKIEKCTEMICHQISGNDRYAHSEIVDYVHRVVADMTDDELAAMETSIPTYASKIKEKLDALEQIYRTCQFKRWLDSGKIVCRPAYVLPSVITPADTIDAIPHSLYEAERNDMNPEG